MENMKYTVLLVDDDKLDQQLTKRALARYPQQVQFKVETVEMLSEAIELLGTKNYDVILLDLGLPDSQGLDGVKKVRAANLQSPVIVLTGLADEELGLEAIKEGADDYVVKGENHLEIRVVNEWTNRLIGDERFPEQSGGYKISSYIPRNDSKMPDWYINNDPMPAGPRTTFDSGGFANRKDADTLIPAGLLGPVKIRFYKVIIMRL